MKFQKISAQQLKEWIEDNYKATRMVMTGVGGNVSQVSRLAEKYFGDLDNVYPRKVPDVSCVPLQDYIFLDALI